MAERLQPVGSISSITSVLLWVMITKNDQRLGNKIKKARKQLRLTQDNLAERIGLSTKYIQFIESATRKPSLKTLYKLAKALEVNVRDLF